MKLRTLACAVTMGCVSAAHADDNLTELEDLTQSQFEALVEDLGAAIGYKAVAPAEPLGTLGFDVGVVVTATEVDNEAAWQTATSSGDSVDTLIVPKLHVHKGLPLGLDVGAFYASVPSTNVDAWGGELRYALLEGGVATPAVGIRGTYSTLKGVDELDLDATGIEVTASKGFTVLTAYGGIGQQWLDGTPKDAAGARLDKVDPSQTRVYAGAAFDLLLLNMTAEVDSTGGIMSYSLKAGLRF